jgi:hypothetical protein
VKAKHLRETFAQLDALYAELPAIACQGKCSIACGALPLTDAEARRLQLVTHRKPRTVPGLLALKDFAPPELRERCVYLTPAGRCSAYDVRPLICRAWGLVKRMSCMHGCVPDRWLTDLEFLRIAQAIERLGGGRILRTEGLTYLKGESFCGVGPVTRAEVDIEADAERVRGLRALRGGRILVATREP